MQMELTQEEADLINNYRSAAEYDRRRISNRTREAAEVATMLKVSGDNQFFCLIKEERDHGYSHMPNMW